MKISWKWLKTYIDPDLPPEKIADLLTGCGLEVEEMEVFHSVKGGLKGVVVGEVLTCVRHPGSDHLSITTVNTGTGDPLHIVCGAANVAAGQKVVVATVGSKLYFQDKELEIRKSKIRGEVSEGMICAEDELGLGPSHEGIMVLGPEAIPGTPASEYFSVEEDFIFGIGLTPNRADAASHIGVARDLAALLPGKELRFPDVSAFTSHPSSGAIRVKIEDPEACPRYSGLTINNISVRESPQWLKNRLTSVGLRPINTIVDITNFVLYELGQPLHVFDADEIKGAQVIIKKLPGNTKFVTLDGVERELTPDDLMICNEKEPMCIAGVFGGIKSGVTEQTRNIFLESAFFDPRTIRKTSHHHGLQTDASFRFERGANYDITVYALKRAALMIVELAGGEIVSGIVDEYPRPFSKISVDLSWSDLDRLTGQSIDRTTVRNILTALGFIILSGSEKGLRLEVPAYKTDVTREEDVIEEVLRIYGYNNIKFSDDIKSTVSYRPKPDPDRLQEVVSAYLSSNGFYEIMNNSLTKSAYSEENNPFDPHRTVKIVNPLSRDLDSLRQTLLFGGLETVMFNRNRKILNVKLYEFGTVYQKVESINGLDKYREERHLALFLSGNAENDNWITGERPFGFYDLKGYLQTLLVKTGFPVSMLTTTGTSDGIWNQALTFRIGDETLATFGSLAESLLKRFDSRQAVFYGDIHWDRLLQHIPVKDMEFAEIPKFPEVRRDLALLLDRSVAFEDIHKVAFMTENKVLKKVGLFDVYEGEGIGENKKSYAISCILQDLEKTLTDKEIDSIMNKLMTAFQQQLNATIR